MGQNAEILYRSTSQTDAAAASDIRKFFPIPQIEDLCYGIEQDFEQLSTVFAALPLNTVHPTDATCFLQSESQTNDKGAFIGRWTRKYYQIPPSWDDWENQSYTFPGTPGYLNVGQGGNYIGRNAYTPVNGVKVRVHRDYFMVGAGQTYANEGLIPDIAVQTYVGQLNPQYFWDPPSVIPAAGITIGNTTYLASVPSKENYFGWVTNAAANGWASGRVGTADANPGQIVISCKPERVMGNLWARVTRYVLAQ
jgi:hypothetical protein